MKVWTKKQQVVSLSTAESEPYAAVKTMSEGLGYRVWHDAASTMCQVSCRGQGKAKHVDVQNQWIQEVSKSGKFFMKKVGTNVNPADLMTKPLPRPKIEQLMKLMGYRFVEQYLERAGLHCTRLVSSQQRAE